MLKKRKNVTKKLLCMYGEGRKVRRSKEFVLCPRKKKENLACMK